ncbi:hypothetical protein QAD02_019456 [Eretmocerus hayati]|uniref:Uncharacterized protein n=1 Tax=Eretmocerus hayati TaxID=131215 RepID=A0ACC2PJB1_9HYME|nr:hypothetical protein QAD02_019456 [Eretmocerus hayati]
MEATEEAEFKVLQECLAPNELALISPGLCKKLEDFFRSKFDEFITAKAVFETGRKSLDQKLNELSKNFEFQKEELKGCQEKLELTEKYSTELQSQLTESRYELTRLNESIRRLEKENIDLRSQKDNLSDENNALHSQVERRNAELERLRTEISSLGSQLQAAVAAKCQVFAEMEEIRSREMSLDYKEKRLEQERTLLSQQMASLEEEINKRTAELQTTRSEAAARTLHTQSRLTQCEEELKLSNESLNQIREVNTSLQQRIEELTQKLEDQRKQELAMHASYREEVTAQTRLADLYKNLADEAKSKAQDYSNAVKELQELLEGATDEYGILETKYNEAVIQHKSDVAEKQKKIDELSRELSLANELLKNLKQERLDQTVEQLAPTAAIASKIMKKGLSLTQIYTQLVEVTSELSLEREENDKLKAQMEIILREIEEKAPMLQKQREDYEAAIANISTLTLRLDDLIAENNRLQEDAAEARRLSNHHTKESQRLKSEMADLARQVCFLLKEVQEVRTGTTVPMSELSSMEIDDLASSQIISKKLVTFKDIEELQENNQKLLTIVRTLSSRQEEIEKATDELNSGEMKEKLDRYIEQLADMQAAQDRQAKMLEGLLKQRDMYKNMYHQSINQSSGGKNPKLNDATDGKDAEFDVQNERSEDGEKLNEVAKKWQKRYLDCETRFNQVSSDLEIYKKEKAAHEQMLNDEIERLRADSERNSNRCCKLKAQLDSANERFGLLQSNVKTYKAQIKTLEDKCNSHSVTIGKHEQTVMLLRNEALDAQSRLSKAEVQLENLRAEKRMLKESESRLLKEREVLQRERHTHSLLKADVESIKASLERVQAEGQLRTEQRLDDSIRECAALRRRLQEEQERFRELTINLERQTNTAQQRLTEEKVITSRLQGELDASRAAEQDYIKRIEELSLKLREASSHIITKPMTGDDNLSKKLKDLEIQLASSQAEVKSLTDQLKAARFQGQQYCDIAESAEAQLRESAEVLNKTKGELESSLSAARDEISTLKTKVSRLEDRLLAATNGQQIEDAELRERLVEAEQKIAELDELKGELELMKSDLQSASESAAAAEDKYAREMVLHSADLQTLSKLKEENQILSKKFTELAQQGNSAQETLAIEKAMWQDREKRLTEEMQELQKRIDDLDAQNALLHNQIQELSEKAAIFQSQGNTSGRISPDASIESMNRSLTEEDSKSAEQLLQVMKYLRREKDLAMAKFDVLKTENARLKSQAESAEKRMKEMREQLDRERENSDIDVLTAAKHSELLRRVETLNAITDSNRVLREERDTLNNKIKELTVKVSSLMEEVGPLREKARDLETKNESLSLENNSLKAEATRWRQRANTLIERANKASPEDWRKLQAERENLSKLLTSERENLAKRNEELEKTKAEKARLEEQLSQVQQQLQAQQAQIATLSENVKRLNQDLDASITDSNNKAKDLANLKKEITEKDAMLADIKNKETQIRKIAKKYKSQYEELAKTMEEDKARTESAQAAQGSGKTPEEEAQLTQERESQLREEGRSELREANEQLITKVAELNQQVEQSRSESETLRKEIEDINKASLEKEERAKSVLKGARTKIMQLGEYKKICEKEINELKAKLVSSASDCESSVSEYEARLAALKSQMEGRMLRLEHERTELQAEKEALLQRNQQLQRQLTAGQGGQGAGTSEPPTANIKPIDQQQTVPSSSTQSVSTSHGGIGHKRPRTLDSSASGSNVAENLDLGRQDQISSPKSKRIRQQEMTQSTAASGSDIEYQVPTSSQRDQDEEGEDGCVVVVACDEGGGAHQPQEEEEFDNDPYEEIEEEEELPYGVEVEGDNNEVEIIMEEDSTSAEVPRQMQSAIAANQQQQSEAISSAGPSGEPSSFASRSSSRGIAPMPRQQPQQHLLLGYEDGGDDCIVPSTPTLFVPRRNDGFGEAVSSPQVPQGRFTFGDPSTPVSVSSVQSHATPTASGSRTMFGASGSGLAQVVQEGMDDTRVDLTQLEDGSTGRSVPSTPQQVSPTVDQLGSVSSGPLDEQDVSVPASSEQQMMSAGESSDKTISPTDACVEEHDEDQSEIVTMADISGEADGDNSEEEKGPEEAGASGSGAGDEDPIDTDMEASEETGQEIMDDDTKEENREAEASPSSNTRQRALAAAAAAAGGSNIVRGSSARRSTRAAFRASRGTRPTPIVWESQSSPRGQSVARGHATRGSPTEGPRVRGARGRRMRGKYPYNY